MLGKRVKRGDHEGDWLLVGVFRGGGVKLDGARGCEVFQRESLKVEILKVIISKKTSQKINHDCSKLNYNSLAKN